MAFTEGTIYDAEGNACAHATGTFKYVSAASLGPQAPFPPTDERRHPMPSNKQTPAGQPPQGEATAGNFKLVDADTPALKDGEVLVRHHFLSLDPYMRGRMNDAKSYAAAAAAGPGDAGRHRGRGGGSRNRSTQAGDKVVGFGGWQEYSVVAADQPGALRKVDTTHVPLSHYLGASACRA
jgi:NADPH-dependent curcumin reductase CurA